MEMMRAQQILDSKSKIDVQLEGTNVWIESLDLNRQTAQVHPEGNKAGTRNVSVSELQEVRQ